MVGIDFIKNIEMSIVLNNFSFSDWFRTKARSCWGTLLGTGMLSGFLTDFAQYECFLFVFD